MNRSLRNILLLAAIIAFGWWFLNQSFVKPLKNIFNPAPIVVDESPLLIKNIRAIAQLMTIEFYDEVVADSTRSAALLPFPPYIIPAKQSLVLVVKGRLLAGLDLQKLDSTDISGNRDSISIRLPKAQVLEIEMNPSDVETFSERGQWSQQAVTALAAKAKIQMLRNAAAQGVLNRADAKAKELVEQMMRYAGYKKINITTR